MRVIGIRPADSSVRSIREQRTAQYWTTVLLDPAYINGSAEFHGFNYSIGQTVSGAAVCDVRDNLGGFITSNNCSADGPRCNSVYSTVATRLETNLNVANNLVDEDFVIGTVDWKIPSITPARLTGADDYNVTLKDLEQIVSKGIFQLYIGGEKPFIEHRLACRNFTDGLVWGQQIAQLEHGLAVHRLEKLFCTLRFYDSPRLGGPVTFVVTLSGIETRSVR